ncbi:MAG: hypothetical protein ACPG49_01955 [Chitinophagales bacterium]
MKNITLSELKQLKGVKEINDTKTTDLKGGEVTVNYYVPILDYGVSSNLSFIPPPGI